MPMRGLLSSLNVQPLLRFSYLIDLSSYHSLKQGLDLPASFG